MIKTEISLLNWDRGEGNIGTGICSSFCTALLLLGTLSKLSKALINKLYANTLARYVVDAYNPLWLRSQHVAVRSCKPLSASCFSAFIMRPVRLSTGPFLSDIKYFSGSSFAAKCVGWNQKRYSVANGLQRF